MEADVVGSMWSYASVDDRLLGFASTPDGPVVGELGADFAGTPLPGPGTFDVSDVVVRDPRPVTAEGMGLGRGREERFDRGPQDINNFGLQGAHDGGDLHLVVGYGTAPASNAGPTDDRWMVTYPRGPLHT